MITTGAPVSDDNFPWKHVSGDIRARIISETADDVEIEWRRPDGEGFIGGKVTLAKPDFLYRYGMDAHAPSQTQEPQNERS